MACRTTVLSLSHPHSALHRRRGEVFARALEPLGAKKRGVREAAKTVRHARAAREREREREREN